MNVLNQPYNVIEKKNQNLFDVSMDNSEIFTDSDVILNFPTDFFLYYYFYY